MRVLFFIFSLMIFSASLLNAGNDNRRGTSGAPELTIPMGAQSFGRGGSVAADVKGTESLFWNPAGIALTENYEIAFSNLNYITDIKYTFLGGCMGVGEFGSIGVSLRVLDIGDIIVTTEESPNGTGEIITPTFINVGFSYASVMTDRVLFGATISYLQERIMREVARGIAFDFGFQYHPGIGGLKIGIVIKNLGPNIRFDGPDLEEQVKLPDSNPQASSKMFRTRLASFELPSSIQFSTSYMLNLDESKQILISGAFRNNNFSKDELSGGMEFSFREKFFLRSGYSYSSQESYLYSATFGFGLAFDVGAGKLFVDYALARTKFFDDNQWVTLKLQF